MKVMRLEANAGPGTALLVLEEAPLPEPAAGEVLVRLRACGVCRTDLHLVAGELPPRRRPIVPGHMAVGIVERAGAGATLLAAGTRVGIAWLRGTCGRCRACVSGRENLCPAARFTGYDEDGGYAEYARVDERWAYPIPSAFSDEEAAPLLCAGIIGYRALLLSGATRGDVLGLSGFGNSAHLVLQIALARGVEVRVVSRATRHRELAAALGASWVGDVRELPEASLDAAILFAPAGELVPPLLRALRPGGTLACAGIHMTPIPELDYARELFGERVLRSVTANTRADGHALLAEAARLGIRPRVTTFALAEANEALHALATDRIAGSAVLRIPS
jgi:propanol-preferring alcohol dehydrogenase